jgi:uncharacterized protein involved in response to NO
VKARSVDTNQGCERAYAYTPVDGQDETKTQMADREVARSALLNLGFRPFYLVASVYAALSVVAWAAQYAGALPAGYLGGVLQHGHEMLFGYVVAVVAGFLLTAVRNWTGQSTPSGPMLAALVALWLAGRILVLTPFAAASALVNAAFPLAVAAAIAIPLVASRNRRNYFFVALLVLLASAELGLHAALFGFVAWPPRNTLHTALDIVLFIVSVVGGRVIPMFTNNGVPGAGATRKPVLERAALGSVLALIAADVAQPPVQVFVAIATFAAVAHALRLWLWQPLRTVRKPIVWILHAAYAWIVLYLVLRALAAGGVVPEPIALHALTVGAIGGMTIGMMTRTARGHTGRLLDTDRFEVAMYALIQVAALIRVVGGGLLPDHYRWTVIAAAICWAMGFGLYAIRYWPILTSPRIDGKPG